MTEKKQRNTTELTYSAAVAKLNALEREMVEAIPVVTDAAIRKLEERYKPKLAAVFARLPAKLHAAAAEEAGVSVPDINDTMDALAAEGPPDDSPDPSAIPERLREEFPGGGKCAQCQRDNQRAWYLRKKAAAAMAGDEPGVLTQLLSLAKEARA